MMISHETKIRVRYSETDRMDFVYYGAYASYFEVARVEFLRDLGFTYKLMEDKGILLPVSDYAIRYHKPARYDDLLLIRTSIPEPPGVRIRFKYEVFNESGQLLTEAETTLVFVDKVSGRPRKAPGDFLRSFSSRLEK
ncbi:MAG: hypothetical protein RLZZ630_1139 [Bacteroidota bacterium]